MFFGIGNTRFVWMQSELFMTLLVVFGHFQSASFAVLKWSVTVICNGAASAQEPLGKYFPVRISNKFINSDCRGDYDVGLCKTLVLGKIMPLHAMYI